MNIRGSENSEERGSGVYRREPDGAGTLPVGVHRFGPRRGLAGGLPLLLLFLIIGLGAVFYLLFHLRISAEIRSARADGELMEMLLVDLEGELSDPFEVERGLEALSRNLARFVGTPSDDTAMEAVLGRLERHAGVLGVGLREVDVHPVEADGGLVITPFSMELTGSYHQLMEFMERIEASARTVVFTGVELELAEVLAHRTLVRARLSAVNMTAVARH